MAAQKLKTVSVDHRGRVTLPAEVRQGIDTFVIEFLKDGSIRLVPQEIVSVSDAVLLRSLKKSVAQAKRGDIEDIPSDWID